MTFDEVDAVCDTEFWEGLEWMHDGNEILSIISSCVKNIQHLYFLTAPMKNLESATGKLTWMKQQMGINYPASTIVTGAPKSLFARPGALLIDDRDKNVEEFRAAGGRAVLVPRPWNRLHELAHKSAEIIKQDLERLGLCE